MEREHIVRDTTEFDSMIKKKAILKRENAIVSEELVKDVTHIEPTHPSTLLRITDLPINYVHHPNYDFQKWKQSKIDDGTWIEKLINL